MHVNSPDNSDAGIELAIKAAGADVAPRVKPDQVEAMIASEHYFTALQGVAGVVNDDMVNRLLTWPVPPSVHPDGVPGRPGRTGTNLLSAAEAREMLAHVVATPAAPPALGLLTFCVLVLRNGFTVTGESACASPENFKADIGRRVARDNAKQKVWPLLGYVLREQLHREQAAADAGGEAWPAPIDQQV